MKQDWSFSYLRSVFLPIISHLVAAARFPCKSNFSYFENFVRSFDLAPGISFFNNSRVWVFCIPIIPSTTYLRSFLDLSRIHLNGAAYEYLDEYHKRMKNKIDWNFLPWNRDNVIQVILQQSVSLVFVIFVISLRTKWRFRREKPFLCSCCGTISSYMMYCIS